MQVKKSREANLSFHIEMVIIALIATGLVFVLSAGAELKEGNELRVIIFKSAFCLLGLAAMYIVSFIPYQCLKFNDGKWWKSLTPWLWIIGIILGIAVLIPGIGAEVNHSRRWFRIPLGFMKLSFQPSELSKWATLFLACAFTAKNSEKISKSFVTLYAICLLVAIPVGVIISEDFGTAAFIGGMAFIVMLLGGAKFIYFIIPGILASGVGTMFIMHKPYRIERIKAFLNPELATPEILHQTKQSLMAISTGGLWGKGLGMGVCKWAYLPEDTTDFIFAVICEELGFAGAVWVLLMFALLAILGLSVSIKCQDPFGKLVAATITLAITIQAAINIGVVTVVLPTKGIPLPFISSGGTSLIVSSAALGVLLNIARQTGKQEISAVQTPRKSKSRSRS